MAVIAIIAILATVLIPTIIGYINRSRKSVVINQCKNIHRIIELRKVDEQFKFKENEKQIRDIFKENASFYNYDLITEKDVNKILEVKLEDELQYISTESLEEVIKNIEIDIIGKNLQIVQNIEPYTINVDGETFSIAISNILSNAIKYSKESGIIEINGRKEEDNYILTFKDYGIGITKEDISKLFERFHRGSNAKKEYPGTGLGLSIVARIIKAHKGNIEIQSELNQYTIVTVTIPLTDECYE